MDRTYRSAPAMTAEKKNCALKILLLAAASILPFLPAVGAPLFFDDLHTVVHNQALSAFDPLRYFTDPTAFSVKIGNWPYRPALLVVNALCLKLFRLQPLAWHLFQLFLHFVNSCLVMVLARRIFRLRVGALFAGLLFACAPLQTQAAIYISARSMVLALGPALLAVLAAEMAAQEQTSRKKTWEGFAVFAAFLAFFSSEGALALLIWLPLAFFIRGISLKEKRAWLALAPIFFFGLLYLLARAYFSPGLILASHPGIKPPFTAFQHFSLQLRTPFFMARLFLFPVHLSLLHSASANFSVTIFHLLVPLLGFFLVAFFFFLFRKEPAIWGGGLWYLSALLPSLLVPLNIPWAEHRAYLALPGLCVMVAFFLERILIAATKKSRLTLHLAQVFLALLFLLLASFSWQRARTWSSPSLLFRDAVRKAPEYDVPWNFLASISAERKEYRRALFYLDHAISRNPYFADPYNTRAECLIQLSRLSEALVSAQAAVQRDPANPTYWNTLAVVYRLQERWGEAEAAFLSALSRLPPQDPNRQVIEKNYQKFLEQKPQSPATPH